MAAVVIAVAAPATGYADAVEDPGGYVRMDYDRVGLQAWVGAQLPVSQTLALAADVYAIAPETNQSTPASWTAGSRLDAGVIFALGPVALFPKLGVAVDFDGDDRASLVPQLMLVLQLGPLYLESWNQLFLRDVLNDGASDVFYNRDLLLVALSNAIAVGVEFEVEARVRNDGGDARVTMPLGACVNLGPTPADTFGVFLGYEFDEGARAGGAGITGRVTYVHGF